MPLRILIVGTLPPPIGGAAVSLRHLVQYLERRRDIHVLSVNTSGVRGHAFTGLFRFIAICARIFWKTRSADVVSLQPVPSGLPFIGPIVWVATRFWGKPLLMRMFGGQDYQDGEGVRGFLVRFFVRSADIYLAQTKALVESAIRSGLRRVEWYPTSRPMATEPPRPPDESRTCRRFVFLSHVKPAKGIRELIRASEGLPEGASVDVYGPLMDGISEEDFEGLRRVFYRGVIPPGDADKVLKEYDALVLPTYWGGEGYPGIILEAYGAGLPVITTRWRSLPEIVDESTGILINPRSEPELRSAMIRLVADRNHYHSLCEGVRNRRMFFDSSRWVDRFVELCRELATTGSARRVSEPQPEKLRGGRKRT